MSLLKTGIQKMTELVVAAFPDQDFLFEKSCSGTPATWKLEGHYVYNTNC